MTLLVHTSLMLITLITINGQKQEQTRVLNSKVAYDAEFPYQALIYDYNSYCGGSIIHKRWILTVAHCKFQNYAALSVFVGTNKNLGSGGVRYQIERFIKHEQRVIKSTSVINDIALVRVVRDIEFGHKVQPVNMPSDPSNTFENSWAVISGWGKLRPSTPNTYLPRNLRYIRVQVISQKQCRRAWPTIAESNICTSLSNRMSTCQGDSGDPLVIDDTQIGIVSYADAECGLVKPTVHTRITSLLPWVEYQMGLYSDRLERYNVSYVKKN